MALDANTGSIISRELAEKLIKAYDSRFPGEVISSFIGSNNVKSILEQEGCTGIRIYNGYDDEEEKIKLVLVGVDENEKEILENGVIYDDMLTCPPNCPVEGGLYP
jgi:hypothetical protein